MGALVTVVVVSVILMVVVIYIVRARHETRRKAMLPADYRAYPPSFQPLFLFEVEWVPFLQQSAQLWSILITGTQYVLATEDSSSIWSN